MTAGVTQVDRLDFRFVPRPWAFADERRTEIDMHFAAAQRANPRLWNGRVLILHEQHIASGILHGAFQETDYASFHAWIDWGRPAAGVWDCFGAAAVMGSDGAFLLGMMAPHTANAGRLYFPCGTPDLDDIKEGRIDFDHSVARELEEETGLDAADFAAEPGWTLVHEFNRIVAYKVLRGPEPGPVLASRVREHLAQGGDDELAGIRLAGGAGDLDPAMPDYVVAFLRHRWG
jgi:8-oxo-dGTP pyrophosphatase MutT (NUDIX family)